MRLYVLRHGLAEEPALGQSDASRELTGEGRRKTRRVTARARQAGARPEIVLTSPYPRAVATAAIACEELQLADAPVETERLTPYGNVFELWEEIRGCAHVNELMVVGHNPLLSDLASWLLGARAGAVPLKKSALAALDIPWLSSSPRAALLWLLTPKSAAE